MPPQASQSSAEQATRASLSRYWSRNLRILSVLLLLWAFVGLGCGILWADLLNRISWQGYPLGFWFAQQGSIVGFVVIILVYCLLMNRLDAQHHEELQAIQSQAEKASSEGSEEGGRS